MDINLHIPLVYITWGLAYLVCGLLTVIFMRTKGHLSFWDGFWIVIVWPFIWIIALVVSLS